MKLLVLLLLTASLLACGQAEPYFESVSQPVDTFDTVGPYVVSAAVVAERGLQRAEVRITDDSVELTGECRTYYTKQMAQHVAMGVLDYQQLVNSINVTC